VLVSTPIAILSDSRGSTGGLTCPARGTRTSSSTKGMHHTRQANPSYRHWD
jgi:hypothetical protein